MFHCTLLDPQLSPHFSTSFLPLALGASPSTGTLQSGLCFGRLAEQSPLTSGVILKAASAVRSSKVEVGHSDLLEVDVNWKGTRDNEGSVCSVEDSQKKRTTVMRKNPLSLRRAGLGQARPPNLVPNCGVQGEPRTSRCDEHCYIRLVRRAACHDRRHLRHRESAFLGPFCHLRDFFSLCTQSPVSRCTSRSIAMREKLNLHMCSTYKADEMRPPWNFLLLWCHSRTQCSMFLGSISIHLPVHQ